MFNSRILETAIGLVFVFLVFSMIASAIAEYISAVLDRRGEHLKHTLFNIFDNDDPRGRKFLNRFVSHPMIQALNSTAWAPTFTGAEERLDRNLDRFRKALGEWESASRAVSAARAAREAASKADAAAVKATYAARALSRRSRDARATASSIADVGQAADDAGRAASEAYRAAQAADAAAREVIKARSGTANDATPPSRSPADPAQAPDPQEGPPPEAQADPTSDGPGTSGETVASAIAQAARAATEARMKAREARRAAGAAVKATHGLYRDLIRMVDIPKYIPDRTFADVVVSVLTSDTLLDVADDVVPDRASGGPGSRVANFWSRVEGAIGVVRGVASRIPEPEPRALVIGCLDDLGGDIAALCEGPTGPVAVLAGMEAATNRLLGAVAAVPDDAIRGELDQAVEASLRRLHAFGLDIFALHRVGENIALLSESSIKTALTTFLDQSGEDLGQFKRSVSSWYNEVMVHTSGWYKRNTQRILLGIAVVLCLLNDVDTVAIVGQLSTDPKLRALVEGQATELLDAAVAAIEDDPGAGTSPAEGPEARSPATLEAISREDLEEAMAKSSLPLWWTRAEWHALWWGGASPPGPRAGGLASLSPDYPGLGSKALGLAISILAVSMGAPFWFDVLNRLVNVRLAARPPESTDIGEPRPTAATATSRAPS